MITYTKQPHSREYRLIFKNVDREGWDPSIEAWQITWTNPAGDHHERQIGRRVGKDVVQIGIRPNGTTTRWMFSEITDDSFRWTGEALNPDGRTWTLEGEFRARRVR